jgi:hypothetical protein
LEKVGEAHRFPATQQPHGHRLVVFAALGMNKDPMAVKIHDMERIETSIVLDVPGPQKVGLMDVVDPQSFSEIRVFHPFGGIRSFFLRGSLFSKFD